MSHIIYPATMTFLCQHFSFARLERAKYWVALHPPNQNKLSHDKNHNRGRANHGSLRRQNMGSRCGSVVKKPV